MKNNIVFTLFIFIVTHGFSQNITFGDIANYIFENFDAKILNKQYSDVIESKGFDFSKMSPTDTILYDNVFVKSYYQENNLIKISIYDTLNKGRNFDIQIIYKDEDVYIGIIVFYYSFNRDKGAFFYENFFINDRKNKIPIIMQGFYWIDIKKPNFNNSLLNKNQIIYDLYNLAICDKNLYFKDCLYFNEGQFMYCSTFDYIYKVRETLLIIQDSDFPILFAKNLTFNDIYKLTNKFLWEYSSIERFIFIDIAPNEAKIKPHWLLH